MSACKHPHGDFIEGEWVCSKCFRFTGGRPHRLGMVQVPKRGSFKFEARQNVTWQAEILRPKDGVPFSEFVQSMARRFMHRCNMTERDAIDMSLSVLRALKVEYGHPDYDWSRASAIGIADEEIQYFDGPHGAN